jgi:regulator of protease activity HflC (stomatin/prohibitin superfamily)
MFLLTIGILVLLAGFLVANSAYNIARYSFLLKVGGIVIAVLGIVTASIRQIDAGTIGVQSVFGKVSPDVLENGLNFVNPLADVAVFDTKTQNYTMSAVTSEGELKGDDAIRVLSADGLEVVIDLTVLYKIMPEKAPAIFKGIGTDYKDKIIRPVTRTRIRDNAVYYDAVALYSKRRDEFQSRIYQRLIAVHYIC